MRGYFTHLKRLAKFDQRSSFALEFAIVAPIFFVLLLIVFEVSYDLFMQEVLDNTLSSAARQVQIGNTQNSTNSTFVKNFMCLYDGGLLQCNSLFVRIEEVTFTPGSCTNTAVTATGDYYDATKGGIPIYNGLLQLGGYYSGAGAQGLGGAINLSPCATITSSSGYCNAGPQQLILMSAVYVAPSFLDGLVLNHVTYNNKYVRAQFSTAAFATEAYPNQSSANAC